jgi:predicted RNA-binding Zn-ribbon protein involved in translation (DUF1610 family)
VTVIPRFGKPVGEAAASFRCGACGDVAAVVRAVSAGEATDMGPSLGLQAEARDRIVVDCFGRTAWTIVEPATYENVRQILSAQAPDPADLQRANWELTLFYCPECSQNYCRADWHPDVLFGQSYYDCTMATCPSGHQHMVDD